MVVCCLMKLKDVDAESTKLTAVMTPPLKVIKPPALI